MKKFFSHSNFDNKIILIIVLALAGLILSYNLGKPFWGHHDFNNVFYGNMARNLVRLPLSETKLGQPTNSGINPTPPLSFHTHHPPLLIWLVALSYFAFGVSEWATRLVPVLFSLGTILYFYKLFKLNFSARTAVVASAFWIISPLFVYFGKMAIQEILVVFFFVFSYYFLSLWHLKKDPKYLYLTIFGLIGGCLSGWAGYYSVFVILVNDWINRKRVDKLTLGLILLPIGLFGLHLGHNYILTGSAFGGGFGDVFILRTSQIPWIEYIKKELTWVVAYFTKPIFLSALLGFPLVWYKFRKARRYLASVAIFGLLHLLIFRQAAFRHDYLIYYLLPLMSTVPALVLGLIPNVKLQKMFFLLVLIASVYSGYHFTSALEESDYNREGVVAGKLIVQNTTPQDRVVLVSEKIYNNMDWQVVFYGNRSLTIVPKLENVPSSCDWLVQDSGNGYYSFKRNL